MSNIEDPLYVYHTKICIYPLKYKKGLTNNTFPNVFELSRNDELPDLDDDWSVAATSPLNNTIATETIGLMQNHCSTTRSHSVSPCDREKTNAGTDRNKRKCQDNFKNINNKGYKGRFRFLDTS